MIFPQWGNFNLYYADELGYSLCHGSSAKLYLHFRKQNCIFLTNISKHELFLMADTEHCVFLRVRSPEMYWIILLRKALLC